MSKGLDYLMGIERRGYAEGMDPSAQALKLLLLQNSGGESNFKDYVAKGTGTPSLSDLKQTFAPKGMMETAFMLSNPMAYGAGKLFSSEVKKRTGYTPTQNIQNTLADFGLGSYATAPAPDAVFGMGERDMGNFTVDKESFGGITGGGDEDRSGGNDDDGGFDSDAEDRDQSGGDAGSTSGADPAGDGGDGYATGGIVNRTGFKFGTKFGRFWKIARKVWDDINPTGDRKYDAQLVADELAEEIFKTSMDDLPQNVQIDLYALAYNNAPKVDALFKNPQSLSEAAKKGMAASKEMESLGLDVSKQSDFFKYENMKLSGELGPEQQVQAYKDKIRDEFSGMIDDTLMKQVEVDDNPQRLAEIYASIKEGLTMQKKGMTPEEIIRVMKQTPRTKNSQGGLNYLMGL
jgi:hypothetical protein